MKKNIKKILDRSEKKIKEQMKKLSQFKFANIKEDFVMTRAEEREGGFFGSMNYNTLSVQ